MTLHNKGYLLQNQLLMYKFKKEQLWSCALMGALKSVTPIQTIIGGEGCHQID